MIDVNHEISSVDRQVGRRTLGVRGAAEPALAAAAGYFGGKGVQVGGPERSEVVEPRGDVAQRLRAHGVQSARALGAHCREPRFAQDAEVLGHRQPVLDYSSRGVPLFP